MKALRKDPDINATDIILKQAESDASPRVRNAAFKTLMQRPLTNEATQRINTLLQQETDDDVRITSLYTALYANSNKQELSQIIDEILSQDISDKLRNETLKIQDYLQSY